MLYNNQRAQTQQPMQKVCKILRKTIFKPYAGYIFCVAVFSALRYKIMHHLP